MCLKSDNDTADIKMSVHRMIKFAIFEAVRTKFLIFMFTMLYT